MKVLVAYDGSESSREATDDLTRAGLPEVGEFIVLSVAEASPNLLAVPYYAAGVEGAFGTTVLDMKAVSEQAIAQHKAIAARGAKILQTLFPKWAVRTRVLLTSAQLGIIETADEEKVDLIVVGSHGASGIGRILMGSVSHNVLTHADCSVRIGRKQADNSAQPPRLLIGVDRSVGAALTLDAVQGRHWPKGTQAKVICVIDSAMQIAAPATHALATEWMSLGTPEQPMWTKAVGQAVLELREAGLETTSLICEGHPKNKILEEAKQWSASCIFVGARGLGAVSRILLGSVSLAVASRANCSVEVVRAEESS